jgi:hypothetical protein
MMTHNGQASHGSQENLPANLRLASDIDDAHDDALRQQTVMQFRELERRAADGSLDTAYWQQLDSLAHSEPVELFPDHADRAYHYLAELAYVGFVNWNRTEGRTGVLCSITEQGWQALDRHYSKRQM